MADLPEYDGLLFDADLPPDHRSGFVAVVGKPNVGKSTLMNQFLGEKLAIVSPRPQTTRERQLGILTEHNYQIVFVDTPGLHRAFNKLSEYMVEVVEDAVPDADVILYIVDATEAPSPSDEVVSEYLHRFTDQIPVLLILNKVDLIDDPEALETNIEMYSNLLPGAESHSISALEGQGCAPLLERIIALLPTGPRYYPADQLTETQVRENVAEVIREKVLLSFEQEIPYAVAVQVDEFKERSEELTYIRATIYVERESQKGIVIGKKGAMLKQIGQLARPDIQEIVGTKVYLDLWVKVLKNWRKDERALRRLGYNVDRG